MFSLDLRVCSMFGEHTHTRTASSEVLRLHHSILKASFRMTHKPPTVTVINPVVKSFDCRYGTTQESRNVCTIRTSCVY